MTEIAGEDDYPEVDVAIIAESTYPFLKGGVSAVIHDIVEGNLDLTFGIIHITWDSEGPAEDLYGVPSNVLWIKTVYLSMREHQDDFTALRPDLLGMRSAERSELAHRLFDALEAILAGDMEPAWKLYDAGLNPCTRQYPLSALLGSAEFMAALIARMPNIGLSLTDTFWLMREFFSLAHALLSQRYPKARVYHAHTTGYASLVGAAAARQNDASFLLTEHNLYVRDTVNTLLERSMALQVTSRDWREFDVTPTQRAWMAWWIEMGHFCYPSAAHITYLYPGAIAEAVQLGAPTDNVSIVPNGMTVKNFDGVYRQRLEAIERILAGDETRIWRLVYIARVVPIKGLLQFIQSAKILIDRGVTNWHLDVLGPTDHLPSYYESCREKIEELGVGQYLTFRGTVNVRAMLGDFDLLVLPSYNEGQPIVVLEAMTAGVPTVGTSVGGMAQLIGEPLTTRAGTTWDSCGVLVNPNNLIEGMADAVQEVLADLDSYERFTSNARGRVEHFFQLHDAMRQYNTLYRQLGGLPPMTEHADLVGPAEASVEPSEQLSGDGANGVTQPRDVPRGR
ncbi:MAG: GT4 family glycosyltransferase PelF [Pseudonocardiaceae bacterium]